MIRTVGASSHNEFRGISSKDKVNLPLAFARRYRLQVDVRQLSSCRANLDDWTLFARIHHDGRYKRV